MVRTEHEKGEEEGVAMLPMDGAPSSSSSEATATPAGAPAKGDAAWKSEWSGYKVRLRA